MIATNDIADDVDSWTFLVETLIAGFDAKLTGAPRRRRRSPHTAVRSDRRVLLPKR